MTLAVALPLPPINLGVLELSLIKQTLDNLHDVMTLDGFMPDPLMEVTEIIPRFVFRPHRSFGIIGLILPFFL